MLALHCSAALAVPRTVCMRDASSLIRAQPSTSYSRQALVGAGVLRPRTARICAMRVVAEVSCNMKVAVGR